MQWCVFCSIVERRSPARIVYEDDEITVFHNILGWLPVMLLVVPRTHRRQEELWTAAGHPARIAWRLGREHCPNGFRMVSNFGYDAMQSQPHAHIHVLGGAPMDVVAPFRAVYRPEREEDGFRLLRATSGWPPTLVVAEPADGGDQESFWQDISAPAHALVQIGLQECPGGFRLVTDVGFDALQTRQAGHLYLQGGDHLGHYV